MLNTKSMAFLLRLMKRVVPNAVTFTDAFTALATKGSADFDNAHISTENVNLYACILSAVGAEENEDKARWVSETCAVAASLMADADHELDAQLADCIDLLVDNAGDTVVGPAVEFDKAKCTIKGNHVIVEGLDAYPTYIVDSGAKFRLQNASYRKGIYERLKGIVEPLEVETLKAE